MAFSKDPVWQLWLDKLCFYMSKTGRIELLQNEKKKKSDSLHILTYVDSQTGKTIKLFEGYHLKKYFQSLKKDDLKILERSPYTWKNALSAVAGGVNCSTIENLGCTKEHRMEFDLVHNIFKSLAKMQDISLVRCVLNFLIFCQEKHFPIRGLEEPKSLQEAIDLITAELAEFEDNGESKTPNEQKSEEVKQETSDEGSILTVTDTLPRLIFLPIYDNSETKGGGVTLSPLNHNTIPLQGRVAEWRVLDTFLNEKDRFLILPVIAPAGAGKTRLITEWLRKSVDKGKWHAGFVESTDKVPWQEWEPRCDTLIIIDYIYRSNDIIGLIIEKHTQCQHYNIRLIILDHVFPISLQELPRDQFTKAFAPDRRTLESRKNLFYPALYLDKASDQNVILNDIIVFVSGKPADYPEIKAALELLQGSEVDSKKTTIGAAQPLFAILIGEAIKNGQNIAHWKRHDLIDFYLNTKKRLPWIHENVQYETDIHGLWVGAFVAAATIRRKLSFKTLRNSLPDSINFTGDVHDKIIDWSNRIVSSNDRKLLKPFEPDILGESFVLLFFRHYKDTPLVRGAFINMLCADECEWVEETDVAGRFIEFVLRLVRNLAHDDQTSFYVEESWETLAELLTPELYPYESPLRLAVALSIIYVSNILIEHKELTQLSPKFLAQINENDLILAARGQSCREAIYTFTVYLDRVSENQRNQTATRNLLLEMNHYLEMVTFCHLNGLLVACGLDCHNTVKLWLELLPELINEQDINYWTPLMIACKQGKIETVKLLLNNNAKPELRNKNGSTALIIAIFAGHNSISRLLIAKDRGLELSDKDGFTALMYASHYGQRDVVHSLMQKMDGLNQSSSDGLTALMLAAYAGHYEITAALAERADLDFPNKLGSTALIAATEMGHLKIVDLLVTKKAKLDIKRDKGWTALMLAIKKGHTQIATLLIQAKASLNIINEQKWSALMLASYYGQKEIVALLIERRADVYLREEHNYTALMFAYQNGHTGIVGLFTDKDYGFDLDKLGHFEGQRIAVTNGQC